jgi:hypothetical protein
VCRYRRRALQQRKDMVFKKGRIGGELLDGRLGLILGERRE